MEIRIEKTSIPDVLVVIPEVFEDERGFFMEVFRRDQFQELGLPIEFVQDNHSRSAKNVLRGLHFQWSPPMGKLMRVTYGSAFLAAVDIRKGSPTIGEWFGIQFDTRKRVGLIRGIIHDYLQPAVSAAKDSVRQRDYRTQPSGP